MAVVVDSADPRGSAAVALATQFATWQRVGDAWRIPSRSRAGASYVVTVATCSCADNRFGAGRPCAHILATRLVAELRAETAAF